MLSVDPSADPAETVYAVATSAIGRAMEALAEARECLASPQQPWWAASAVALSER